VLVDGLDGTPCLEKHVASLSWGCIFIFFSERG
jgi:hypothetical protein